MARRSFGIGFLLSFIATSLFIDAKKRKAKNTNVAPVQATNQYSYQNSGYSIPGNDKSSSEDSNGRK